MKMQSCHNIPTRCNLAGDQETDGYFRLFDVSGRMLDEKFLSKDVNKIEIKVTYLEAGLYFFKIESKQTLFTDKIIIH